MKKMPIDLPEPVFRSKVRVLYGDTDAGGVVYYGNYLRFFEQGRTEFMRNLEIPYREIEDLGMILPVVECYSRYKASAFYDDMVRIETALVEAGKVSCRFHYRIFREQDNTLLNEGFTVHAVVDRQGKLTRLPANIYEKLKEVCS